MTFPTPEVAGVFLNLSQRVKGAITSGKAAHYLIGGAPERLRNNLGFHGAIAEFVDALLERAVLPYQTTISLPNLAVLPDANLPGHDPVPQGETPPPEVYAPVSFDSVISTARKRARLGHEKRLAPLEFWKAMFRGSDALARFRGPVVFPTDAGGGSDDGDEPDIAIYPPVMFPDSGESYHDSTYYGFHDVVDTGWEASSEYPSGWRPSIPLTSYDFTPSAADEIGRVALDVWLMLDYPDDSDRTSGATLPMLLSIAGFTGQFSYRHHGYTDTRGVWPWFLDPYGDYNFWHIHGGFQFAGKIATYRHYDWDHWGPGAQPASWATNSPYNFDYAGGIVRPELELAVAKAYNALRSVGIYDPATWEYRESDPAGFPPWISPFDPEHNHRTISTTARANLDVLRIQQVLLGSMWANWAKMRAVVKVPHHIVTTLSLWQVHVDGSYDVQSWVVEDRYFTLDNEVRWSHEVVGDRPDSDHYGCCSVRYGIDLSVVEDEGGSGGEDYLVIDRIGLASVGYSGDVEAEVRAAQAEKARAEAARSAAESDMAAAESDWNSLIPAFAANFAATPGIDRWIDGLRPDRTGHIYHSPQFDVFFDDSPTAATNTYSYAAYTNNDGTLDVQSTARAIMNTFWQRIATSSWDSSFRPVREGDVSTMKVERNGLRVDVPAGAVPAALRYLQAKDARDQASADVAAVADIAENGVRVDVSSIVRGMLDDVDLRFSGAVVVLSHGTAPCDIAAGDDALIGILSFIADNPGCIDPTTGVVEGALDHVYMPDVYVEATSTFTAPVQYGDSDHPWQVKYRLRSHASSAYGESAKPVWPAESVVDGGYVADETVAVGLEVDDDVKGWYKSSVPGECYDVVQEDPSGAHFRRIAMNWVSDELGTSPPDVDAPSEAILRIVAGIAGCRDAEGLPSQMPRAVASVIDQAFARPLDFCFSASSASEPTARPTYPSVFAWFHPDKSPCWAAPSGPNGMRPWRVVVSMPGGDDAVFDLRCPPDGEGLSSISVSVAYCVSFTSQTGEAASVSEETVRMTIGDHVALRAKWNWKSMPVGQE